MIDQNLPIGADGVLAAEFASAIYGRAGAPLIARYVGGLGGRDICAEEFYRIAAETHAAVKTGVAPEPRLLYTAPELREVRKLQAVALAERREIGGGG